MPTVLVSGAANGLGAEFVKAYAEAGADVIAIDRSPINATQHGGAHHNHIKTFTVDVSSPESIETFARALGDEIAIDLVIHSAGVRGLVPDRENTHHGDVAACETLAVMDADTLLRTYQINAMGTFLLLRALLPSLKRASATTSADPAKVIVLSSRMGSLATNELPNKDAGAAYAYRASKAATNMLVRSLAVDVPEVTWVMCHPGRVETALVRWKEAGAISPAESVAGLMPLIARWGKADSGHFYDRFGEFIPW